jgi:hypothetical protein
LYGAGAGMLMQQSKNGQELELLNQAKDDIESAIINCFTEATGRKVIDRHHKKVVEWLDASTISIGIVNENAGFRILTVPESDRELWERSIPIEHEYKMYRDIAAYGFDKLYVTVLCGLNLYHKLIEHNERIINGITELEIKRKQNPLFR